LILTIAALAAGGLLGAPRAARAQEASPTLQIHQVDGSNYPTVRAIVSALDSDGAPIPGLIAASFQPLEGETPITLAGLDPASDGDQRLGVAIVIDTSSNMDGAPLDAAKLAAIGFVRGLGAGDEAAVFAFNGTVTTVVPFTLDRNALTYGIAGLSADGSASLHEAALTASFAAGAVRAERKAVVILTGSGDTIGNITAEHALDVARDAAVPVFGIGLGEGVDEAFMEQLSAATMGQYREVGANDAGGALAEVASVLRGQYVLTMTGRAAADRGRQELRILANINGTPAGAVATFLRGAPPAGGIAEPGDDGGGSSFGRAGWMALLALLGIAAAGAAGAGATRVAREIRVARHQREVVAPNQQRAAAQPLPRPVGALRPAVAVSAPALPGVTFGPAPEFEPAVPAEQPLTTAPVAAPVLAMTTESASTGAASRGIGRFVEKTAHGRGQTYELGAGPIVIGSSPRDCTIVLPPSADVAPAHVRIWLRDGKYVMHHAGGFRRRTLVGGQPTDWCVLEHGDELQIGPHKLVYVEEGNDRPLRF
jgi:hypothetical protein